MNPWPARPATPPRLGPCSARWKPRSGSQHSRDIVCFGPRAAWPPRLNLQRFAAKPERLYLCATSSRRGASALASHSQPGLDHRPHHARPRADHRGPGVAGRRTPCPARCRNVGCHASQAAGCRLKEQQMYLARLDKARQRLMKLQAQVVAGTFTTKAVILARRPKSGRPHPRSTRHLLLHAATHGDRQGIAGPRERRGDSG